VRAFVDYLSSHGFRYVILRFSERFPSLHRAGGDIDFLIGDEGREQVFAYLDRHHSAKFEHPVGVWFESFQDYRRNMAYYPPHIARQILDRAIWAAPGIRSPCPRDAFLSLAYHCLYHKGLASGIPSTLGLAAIENPENAYLTELERLAHCAGITLPERPKITMEFFDVLLDQEGWRPSIDLLGKLGIFNEWVRDRFSTDIAPLENPGVGTMTIRQAILDAGLLSEVIATIRRNGFEIIDTLCIEESNISEVKQWVRGGSYDSPLLSSPELPAMMLVLVDVFSKHPGYVRLVHGQTRPSGTKKNARFIALKRRVRRVVSSSTTRATSPIHISDNGREATEHIRKLLPATRADCSEDQANSIWQLASGVVQFMYLRLRYLDLPLMALRTSNLALVRTGRSLGRSLLNCTFLRRVV
jgi:hypothetical protein